MTGRAPAFSSHDLIRALQRLGFIIKPGGKGSHVKLAHPVTGRAITVPKNKNMGKGIRTALIKQLESLGVDVNDLIGRL